MSQGVDTGDVNLMLTRKYHNQIVWGKTWRDFVNPQNIGYIMAMFQFLLTTEAIKHITYTMNDESLDNTEGIN